MAVPTQDFSALYGRWMPTLTRYCRTILRSDADAEDAAQNAMLKAMDALAAGPAPDHLPPWLHRIARNESISLMRRRRDAVALEEHHDTAGPTTEEVAATRRRLGDLLRDLQALPERQREALVMRELDGLSHRAIAAQLGITEAAAQQAVLDARRSLHDYADGRALACDRVQTWLSAHEHARLRSRGVRAHLRDCGTCTHFAGALRSRPRDLAALLPVAGASGFVARIAALFAAGPIGAKVALGLGVLATAGAGLTLDLPAVGDRGTGERPVVVERVDPAPAATAREAAPAGGRERTTETVGTAKRRDRLMARGGRRADADAGSAGRGTGREPTSASPGPASTAGAPSTGGGEETRRPSSSGRPGSGSGSAGAGSGSGSPTVSAPSAPKPVADAIAPVVQAVDDVVAPVTKAVDEAVAPVSDAVGTVTDQATGTVDQVLDGAAAADPTGAVGQVTGALGGG